MLTHRLAGSIRPDHYIRRTIHLTSLRFVCTTLAARKVFPELATVRDDGGERGSEGRWFGHTLRRWVGTGHATPQRAASARQQERRRQHSQATTAAEAAAAHGDDDTRSWQPPGGVPRPPPPPPSEGAHDASAEESTAREHAWDGGGGALGSDGSDGYVRMYLLYRGLVKPALLLLTADEYATYTIAALKVHPPPLTRRRAPRSGVLQPFRYAGKVAKRASVRSSRRDTDARPVSTRMCVVMAARSPAERPHGGLACMVWVVRRRRVRRGRVVCRRTRAASWCSARARGCRCASCTTWTW